MRTHGARPSAHLEDMMALRLRRERGPRDKLLRDLGAPNWMFGKPEPRVLGVASPTLVYAATVLASPFGLSPPRLPELIQRQAVVLDADAVYVTELRRLIRLVDTQVRQFAPELLRGLGQAGSAAKLAALPELASSEVFWDALFQVTQVLEALGPAVDFEERSRTLEEALRARGFAYAVIGMRVLAQALDAEFAPDRVVPELRAFNSRLIVSYAAYRAADPARADDVGLALLDALVAPPETLFAPELRLLAHRIERARAQESVPS